MRAAAHFAVATGRTHQVTVELFGSLAFGGGPEIAFDPKTDLVFRFHGVRHAGQRLWCGTPKRAGAGRANTRMRPARNIALPMLCVTKSTVVFGNARISSNRVRHAQARIAG
jgi:hypothetical protein